MTSKEGEEKSSKTLTSKELKVSLSDGSHVVIPMNEVVFQEYDYQDMINNQQNGTGSKSNNNNHSTSTNGKVIASKPGSPPTAADTGTSGTLPNVDIDSSITPRTGGHEDDNNVHTLGNKDQGNINDDDTSTSRSQQPSQSRVAFADDSGNPLNDESREFERISAKKWMEKFEEKKKKRKKEEEEEETAKKMIGSRLAAKFRARKKPPPQDDVPKAEPEVTERVEEPKEVLKREETSPTDVKLDTEKVQSKVETEKVETEKDKQMKKAVKKVQPKLGVLKRKGAPPILSLPGGDHPDQEDVSSDETQGSKDKPVPIKSIVTAKKKVAERKKAGKKGEEVKPDEKPSSGGELTESSEVSDEPPKSPKQERPRSTEPQDMTKAQTMTARLIVACKRNDWIAVETYLKHLQPGSIDVHLVTEVGGWTPVHFAAKENRVFVVEKLLDLGYNVNAKSKDAVTALHLACIHAREDTIRALLLRQADPMIAGGPKAQLPIHLVCSKTTGAAVIILQLLLKSAPKEQRLAKDSEGNIPLFYAIEAQNYGIIRELLAEMAAEQVAVKKVPSLESVVHMCLRKRDIEMMKMMVDAGADIDAQNEDGQTILHKICADGLESWAKYLYSVGANPNVQDDEDRTPLFLATEKGHFRIVELLTEKFKAGVHHRTKDGSTLMHIASAAGHASTAAIFMKKGVSLYMPNKRGIKAIHLAATKGNIEVLRNVLARGENVDVKTNEGLTALHLAVQAEKPEVVEVLLGHGASVHLKAGKSGETALHACCRTKNGHECADLLIKSGAPINETNEDGETAFHIAARYGHITTLRLLLTDGADHNMLNKLGENVLHIVCKECHFEIAQRLIQHVIATSSKEAATKLVNQPNKAGESSLHYVASLTSKKVHYPFEDRDLMRLLLLSNGDPMLEALETRETSIHYCSKSGNINVLEEIIGQMQPQDAQTACNKQAKNGWSPLLYACYHGHPEIIKILMTQNARVDVFDEAGRASLHLAAELGHEDVIKLLLENNAFVNVRNKHGLTPLHIAARKGYDKMVRQLVSNGAVVDSMTLIKQTPLHLSAESGQLHVATTLLQLKADVNALDNLAQTPLHLAAQNDHPDVLKLFLQHKPELVSVPNKNGQTCAHIAAEKGSVAVLKELMKFNVETVKTARIKKTGNTALHLACEGGHVKVVRQLLQAGAKPGDENSEGYTALHAAARNGHLRVLAALKGACDWKLCSRKNGLTALHVAAKFGQTDFVSEMLTQVPAGIKSERSLNDPHGDYGITPLHLASQNGHESTVRLLMNSKGVHVDEPTQVNASTPMHYTAQGGHLLVAGLIISRSTDSLKITDKNGKTCVHVAAAAGNKEMVALLLGQGAEINTQDKRLWTPLHYAARYGYLDVVELLVDSGADPTSLSKDNKVPLCAAASAGHYDVMNYLLKKEHDTLALMDDRTFLIDMMNCAKSHENKPIREFILVSEAPIDTAVKLAKCYENLALRDKERSKDLDAACHYCDQVAIDLLTVTATLSNPGALLRGIDHKNTEFLDVLIELERKDVVSQHAVQRYLTEVWMGRLKWSGGTFVGLFFAFLFCPLVWIIVSVPIGHNLGKKPIIKFTSYLTSHIFFICILTYTVLNVQLPLFDYESLFPYWFEWLLLIWIIGICTSEFTNPSDKSGLGAIKIIILTICFFGVVVHVGAIIADFTYYANQDFRTNEQLYHALYIRNQLFAFALLLSFVEFLNFLTFHPLFGPWGVIIQDLIRDLLLFMAILAIFLAGFTLQVCAIYQPVYRPPNNNNGSIPEIGSVFQSPALTFEMLFYALFGLVEPDAMPPMHLNPPFSKYIMKIVFGIFMMVTVIVLINLLIAMMSNTYQRIEAQSDIEWKFGRAKLIRNMNRTLPTPSPINLFFGIPLLMFDKLQRRLEEQRNEKEMALAKQAFGHLDGQRQSVAEAKKWLNRRASRASKASRATSAISNFGAMETGTDELRPIADVVNWPLIVQKYLESIGAVSATADDDEGGGEAPAEGGVGGGDAAPAEG